MDVCFIPSGLSGELLTSSHTFEKLSDIEGITEQSRAATFGYCKVKVSSSIG